MPPHPAAALFAGCGDLVSVARIGQRTRNRL